MNSLRWPSFILLVIGSCPLLSSWGSGPVAQLQPTLLPEAAPTTPSTGSRFLSDWLILSVVAACTVGRAGCRGFRPTASTPYRACTYTSHCSGGHTVFSFNCHKFTKSTLGYRSRTGDFGLPFTWSIWPFHLQNSSMVLTYDFVLLATVPLPCLGRMGCVAGLRLGCLRVWYMLFSFRDWPSCFQPAGSSMSSL